MTLLAIMIKTFHRKDLFYKCIESIKKNIEGISYRIYIADDSKIDDEKNKFYVQLENEGHFVLRLPYNIGASAGRNAIIPFIKEQYVLRLDDDFLITAETHLDKMLHILETIDNLGVISDIERQLEEGKNTKAGYIRTNSHGWLIKIGKTLVKKFIEPTDFLVIDNIRFFICDFTRNFLLIKRKMLNEIQWADNLKIDGEHEDFMLKIKYHPYWKLAFTPDSIHTHAGPTLENLSKSYLKKRINKENLNARKKHFQEVYNCYYYTNHHDNIKNISVKKYFVYFLFSQFGYLKSKITGKSGK